MMTKDDTQKALDVQAARERLSGQSGKRFWRSLDEWSDTDEFREIIERHFPSRIDEVIDPFTRRTFLKVMGASLAFAGVTGCAPMQPIETIWPYAANPPAGLTPGRPLFFATAMTHGGYARGVVVESNTGRPTKIEGNALHPASLGAADAHAQASVLSLYDPDRSQTVVHNGRVSNWDAFLGDMTAERLKHKANGGVGLRFLSGPITSPTLAAQAKLLFAPEQFPNAKWYTYEPVARTGARVASTQALGGDFDTLYSFEKADLVVSLDANFLVEGPAQLAYARHFTARRKVTENPKTINRLFMVESSPTLTGANADNRLRVKPSQVETAARAIAKGVGVAAAGGDGLTGEAAAFVATVIEELKDYRGTSIVIPGDYATPAVHALAHAMNQALGNVGTTVSYIPAVEVQPVDPMASIVELVGEIKAGKVDTLVMLGVNPVYDAPVDLGFGDAMAEKVRLRIHLNQYADETAFWSNWHVNEAHYLESWGDARAFDGTLSIIQPLIAPLYGGKTVAEVLAGILGQGSRSGYDIVREHWMKEIGATVPGGFESFWQKSLNDGVVTLPTPPAPPPAAPAVNPALFATAPAAASGDALEIAFRPCPSVWDGSFANNGWLQELPRPLTKLTWDNAAIMSVRTANKLGVEDEHVVELTYKGRSLKAPVRVLAGHPEGFVTVYLGYGRERSGRVGNGVGFNAYSLRTSDSPWSGSGLEAKATGEMYTLALTEHHNMISAGDYAARPEAGSLDDHYSRFNSRVGEGAGFVDGQRGREIVRVRTFAEFTANPHVFAEQQHEEAPEGGGNPVSGEKKAEETEGGALIPGTANEAMMQPQFQYDHNRWGMTIDTQSCIGCNACVIACQSENNIPVVGKEQVIMNREMHWIRIDTYFEGRIDDPDTYFQPVPCMQCENAPCEVVCPVGATVHSEEGLNDMVYNRCVGTRYCSNNCPYKVRRFNFLKYSDQSPLAQLRSNPNVTIRARGVMEKCTYCVQRIWRARITAERENRAVRDGDIVTACQQTCPTEAIVFGNLNDPESKVVKLKKTPLNYGMLADLNTRPRTSYLARVTNPNPELKA